MKTVRIWGQTNCVLNLPVKTRLKFTILFLSYFSLVHFAFSQTILIHPLALSRTVVDLLSGTLTNAGNAKRINHQAEVFRNGPLIVKGTSERFDLQPGTLVINSLNAEVLLNPLCRDSYSPVNRDSIQRMGALPPAHYLICVRAYADKNTQQIPFGVACYNPSVMDLNLPISALPSKGEVVDQSFPTFVWTPPTPLPVQPSDLLRSMPPSLFQSAMSTAFVQNPESHRA